ncbi:spermidine/putrescine ABC transporter substrate-binding protein [Sphaerisporangium melleum]|uniref:Spermidine/putrescine ABC transporter substrate-binding protein n=1 Tax=Sphaerisporangium melleum TaxID=321316 RepID=A0A917VIZ9_9ACTN|nr:extracellular solute-binding protein [Sphaerisporangium melleum]GGK84009.1 spermidine/putrescine ABC transporter substrate-binding protein [Sphaerisporangium melleum]GII69340.1 spermidine/putrescine ABC transporter substrate-binding protein [Sphaerisporangium melleum]
MVTGGRRLASFLALITSAAVAAGGCGGMGRPDAAAGSVAARSAATPVATPASPSAPPVTPTPSPSPTALGPGEGTVTVLTFRGYAEYGGTQPAYNWVTPFERATGCRVNLRFPAADDQMDKMLAGTAYDVVSAPPEVGGRLVAERKVVPITTSLVPNYDEIPEWLRAQRSVTAGGQVYGVPYLWGWYATLYDSGRTRPPAGSALYEAPGPVALRDSPMTIADAALALRRLRPKLGIDDPYQLTPAQLDAAIALLGAGRGTARTPGSDGGRIYWKEPVQAMQALAGGTAEAARTLPYHLDILRKAGHGGWKAVPDAPATGWADSWMISTRAAAPNCAYRWIDWSISAEAQQQASVWNLLAPANPGACDLSGKGAERSGQARRERDICAAYRVGDESFTKKVAFAVLPGSDCEGADGECTDYAEWAARWRALVE